MYRYPACIDAQPAMQQEMSSDGWCIRSSTSVQSFALSLLRGQFSCIEMMPGISSDRNARMHADVADSRVATILDSRSYKFV